MFWSNFNRRLYPFWFCNNYWPCLFFKKFINLLDFLFFGGILYQLRFQPWEHHWGCVCMFTMIHMELTNHCSSSWSNLGAYACYALYNLPTILSVCSTNMTFFFTHQKDTWKGCNNKKQFWNMTRHATWTYLVMMILRKTELKINLKMLTL